MIYVVINSKYASHIAYILYLLDIDCTVFTNVEPNFENLIDDHEHIEYYQQVTDNLNRETKFFLPFPVIAYQSCNVVVNGTSTSVDKHLSATGNLHEVEYELFEYLQSRGDIPNEEVFTDELLPNKTFIEWSFQRFFRRNALIDEITFHRMNIITHRINVVAWLLIIRFCEEGMLNGLHQEIYNLIRVKKYLIPRIPNIAVIMHGYVRNYDERLVSSHSKFLVDNPYIDIFIHAWSDIGHKYERQLEKLNPVDIINKYNPKALKLDNVWERLKSQFSLVGKLYPILLKNNQDKADATQYVNATLFSIRTAFGLIEIYETQHNFQYNGIIKWNFDTDVTAMNIEGIWKDIQTDILWFRCGCTECDKESLIPFPIKKHDDHKNDIDTSWYYGPRYYMGKALKLHEEAFLIAEEHHLMNVTNVVNVPHKQHLDFIYIYDDKHINYNKDTAIVCYHPHTLMKIYLKNFFCKTCKNLQGEIIKPAVFSNNI